MASVDTVETGESIINMEEPNVRKNNKYIESINHFI